jgi:hypothetical protein
MDDQTRTAVKTKTLVAQGLGLIEPVTKALVSPIHMSATYLRDADNGYSGATFMAGPTIRRCNRRRRSSRRSSVPTTL